MAIIIIILLGLILTISFFVTICDATGPEYELYVKKGSLKERRRGGITDYGCREDFSERFEDDPWSMFRS